MHRDDDHRQIPDNPPNTPTANSPSGIPDILDWVPKPRSRPFRKLPRNVNVATDSTAEETPVNTSVPKPRPIYEIRQTMGWPVSRRQQARENEGSVATLYQRMLNDLQI